MARTDVFKHGSKWVRADFHLHTRSDHTFKYSGDERYFLSDYVDALKQSGIGVGVITNHNQFDYDEFIALQKTAMRQDIMLLPGVELRVREGANGVHTLVVFSDEWISEGNDHVNQFIGSVFEGRSFAERRSTPTSCGLLELIERLDRFDKDYFLIFAHVEERSGLWKELDGGLIREFGKDSDFRNRTLGFQKVRSHNQLNNKKVCRAKVKRWLEGWYPAEVEGSDPKSIEEIGQGRQCYIKIGYWSFDAVKYALLDHIVRVAEEPETCQHSYIKEVEFEGGLLDGQTIAFSPGLNTLIGIRGSGKSSIIESIRYAFNIPLGDMVAQKDPYKENLPAFVLGSGGKVTVRTVDQHGQEYEVRRIYNEAPDVFINGVVKPGISLRETVLRNPIYFGQKDLSSTSLDFEKGLVERMLGDKLDHMRTQIDTQEQAVREIVARLKTLAGIEERISEYQAKKADAEYRLKQYSRHGIEEKLGKQVEYDKDARKFSAVISTAREYVADLENLLSQHEDELKNHLHYRSKFNSKSFESFFEAYSEIVTTSTDLQKLIIKTKTIIAELERRHDEFENERDGLKEEFAEIERALAAELKQTLHSKAINTSDFRQLRATIDQANQMLRALNNQLQEREDLETKLQHGLAKLKELWHQEFLLLRAELDDVNKSDTPIAIEAHFKGDKAAFLDFFKGIFRGSRIREDTFRTLVGSYPDFIDMYKSLDDVTNGLNPTFRDKFRELFLEYLSDLLTYQVPNQFEIRYHGLPLREHSLGQRASALILFILSQKDSDVVIIDQPEDDLDNQTIYEDVIKLVMQLKSETQFIFATHNANFPVLGDAEQVMTCEYGTGNISVRTGSIDKPEIQNDIVSIMEGGEEAFIKRGRKYETWKPQSS